MASTVALLGACASSPASEAETAEPSLGSVGRMNDTARLQLPLDAYLVTDDDSAKLQSAYRARLRQCVAGFGLELVLAQPATRGPALPRNARRYGATDSQVASVYGYRVPSAGSERKPVQPELSPAVQTVLSGKGTTSVNGKAVPPGGCVAQAQKEIFAGTNTAEMDLANRLSGEAFSRSQADSRTRAAFAAWSACMKTKGFDYANPDAAIGDPAFASATASKREISTAKADIACKQQTNLVGIWAAVEAAYQQRLVAKNKSALDALRQLQQKQIVAAAAILRGQS